MSLGGCDVVIPTIGRLALDDLLTALARQADDLPGHIVLVDDRPDADAPLQQRLPVELAARTTVVRSHGRGPAAARNRGWRETTAPWIAFLDDDVVPAPDWARTLSRDLSACAEGVAAVQGSVDVPVPTHGATDRQRNVARLAAAPWITADLAVRRDALVHLGGFDERFRRAYREDTDLQLRASAAGLRYADGQRRTTHPVGPAPWWSSVAAQRGNADDALLLALHGRAALESGRRDRHQVVTVALVTAVVAGVAGRHRLAALGATAWALGTGELAWARLRNASHAPAHLATVLATSVAIPPTATYHWWSGRWRHRCERLR